MNAILLADLVVMASATGAAAAGWPMGPVLALPLAAFALSGAAASVLVLGAYRSAGVTGRTLYDAIEALEPKFILYYGVRGGTEYQVRMWIEYLERIGEPFLVVLRKASAFETVAEMTSAPVIVRGAMSQLDDVVVPSMTAAFYVNNGALNAHLVRYPQLTHVQLLHGDSDKATSFNPITGMFDKIFVAGQAAIDRYRDHGVHIPAEKFVIVGRPQVETVQQATAANYPARSVLYAPTWQGHFADTNYGSMSVGPQIVRALIARGMRVVFRPHPYSYSDDASRRNIRRIHELLLADDEANGRGHVWGDAAERELDVFGCFNQVDAMISDVSSVVPDFLYSGKPFAVVAMSTTPQEFADEFPLARAGYVIDAELVGLEAALDELLERDSKEQQRRAARTYYLGPFDAGDYADNFVQAARRTISGNSLPARGNTDVSPTGGRASVGSEPDSTLRAVSGL